MASGVASGRTNKRLPVPSLPVNAMRCPSGETIGAESSDTPAGSVIVNRVTRGAFVSGLVSGISCQPATNKAAANPGAAIHAAARERHHGTKACRPAAETRPVFVVAVCSNAQMKIERRLKPRIRRPRKQAHDDACQRVGDSRVCGRHVWGVDRQHCVKRLERACAPEWMSPGQHLVQHHAQSKQVRARIDGLARHLFGSHVAGGADDDAGHSMRGGHPGRLRGLTGASPARSRESSRRHPTSGTRSPA